MFDYDHYGFRVINNREACVVGVCGCEIDELNKEIIDHFKSHFYCYRCHKTGIDIRKGCVCEIRKRPSYSGYYCELCADFGEELQCKINEYYCYEDGSNGTSIYIETLWDYKKKIYKKKAAKRGAAKRRELEKNAEGFYTQKNIDEIFELQNRECVYCKVQLSRSVNSKKYKVEHMTSLYEGGTNWPDNIGLSCDHCNSVKGSKSWREYFNILKKDKGKMFITERISKIKENRKKKRIMTKENKSSECS